jgi:hypothetical protein
MGNLVVLFIHLIATMARLLGSGGVRSMSSPHHTYKLRIVKEAEDAAATPGGVGALLRREVRNLSLAN